MKLPYKCNWPRCENTKSKFVRRYDNKWQVLQTLEGITGFTTAGHVEHSDCNCQINREPYYFYRGSLVLSGVI